MTNYLTIGKNASLPPQAGIYMTRLGTTREVSSAHPLLHGKTEWHCLAGTTHVQSRHIPGHATSRAYLGNLSKATVLYAGDPNLKTGIIALSSTRTSASMQVLLILDRVWTYIARKQFAVNVERIAP